MLLDQLLPASASFQSRLRVSVGGPSNGFRCTPLIFPVGSLGILPRYSCSSVRVSAGLYVECDPANQSTSGIDYLPVHGHEHDGNLHFLSCEAPVSMKSFALPIANSASRGRTARIGQADCSALPGFVPLRHKISVANVITLPSVNVRCLQKTFVVGSP